MLARLMGGDRIFLQIFSYANYYCIQFLILSKFEVDLSKNKGDIELLIFVRPNRIFGKKQLSERTYRSNIAALHS